MSYKSWKWATQPEKLDQTQYGIFSLASGDSP